MMNRCYSRGRHSSTISRRAYNILIRRPFCGSRTNGVAPPLGSSSIDGRRRQDDVSRQQQQTQTQLARRCKSSSAFPDFPMPESIRQSAKTTLLNEAVRDDSRWWQNHQDHRDVNGTSDEGEEDIHRRRQPNSRHQFSRHDYGDDNNSSIRGGGVGEGAEGVVGAGGEGEGVNAPIVNNLKDESIGDLYIRETADGQESLALSTMSPPYDASCDPFQLAKTELDDLSRSIREDLIGTDHPVLNKAASYFFESAGSAQGGGKKIRPMMVLLLSRALSDTFTETTSSEAITSAVATDKTQTHSSSLFSKPLQGQRGDLPQSQRRLAEISEMMHTASLFHDDVIDGSDTRRGVPTVHSVFGNKMAILAGDYLLARASICLARLRDVRVVETMSTIIENLVRGEVMQMRGAPLPPSSSSSSSSDNNDDDEIDDYRMKYYLRKNYYKTASLMANSCKSTALLGNYPTDIVDASYKYGKHVGMAFQLVDDILDYEGSLSQLGKPPLADLKAGLATGPVLFAAEEYPDELNPLINRKFDNDGDVDTAVDLVFNSHGIERTKKLARAHAEYAIQAIVDNLSPSPYRDSLIQLAYKVVARTK